MMPASAAIHWWWPVLLAMLVNGVGQYMHLLYPNDIFESEFEAPKLASAKDFSFAHFGVPKSAPTLKRLKKVILE